MITAKAFAGKHYAVYGLARSGLATVQALLASGAKVTAWDAKEEARANAPPGTAIANLDEANLSQFDSLVVTPGLPLNRHPIAQRARDAGLTVALIPGAIPAEALESLLREHRIDWVILAGYLKLVNIPVLRPTITIIIGRSNDWDDPAKEQLRILNSTPLEHQSSYVRSPACDGEYSSIVRAGGRNPILTGAFYSGSKVAVNQGSMMQLHRGASELLDLLSRNSDVSDCFTRTQ